MSLVIISTTVSQDNRTLTGDERLSALGQIKFFGYLVAREDNALVIPRSTQLVSAPKSRGRVTPRDQSLF